MMWATCGQRNFYPRPLWGGRLMAISITFYQFEFLSTPSVGRATQIDGHQLEITKFLSTPSVGRATQHSRPSLSRVRNFYPRPPWGGRQCFLSAYGLWAYFYPRPPWGGRPATAGTGDVLQDFYPRPPWGGRPGHCILWARSRNFYPRPPWGGRPATAGTGDVLQDFYPRPPWGGRLLGHGKRRCPTEISIHALRGEGDQDAGGASSARRHFYPRPPWGGRPL